MHFYEQVTKASSYICITVCVTGGFVWISAFTHASAIVIFLFWFPAAHASSSCHANWRFILQSDAGCQPFDKMWWKGRQWKRPRIQAGSFSLAALPLARARAPQQNRQLCRLLLKKYAYMCHVNFEFYLQEKTNNWIFITISYIKHKTR